MQTKPQPRPGIIEIAPYIGGEAKAEGDQRLIRLASNECAYGPPANAVEALRTYLPELHRYPDGNCTELRAALGAKHSIDPACIVCGAGSDELIGLIVKAYAGADDEVLYSQYGFLMYGIAAKACGATPVTAPEKADLKADIPALLAHVTNKTKVLLLANPNNPTGSMLTRSEVAQLHAGLPPHVVLVLDAAYTEFVTHPDYSAGDELVTVGNVIVLRTFSKIYGMAGPRLGWAHCSPEIAAVLNRVRGAFNVSAPAQVAGLAALSDLDFVPRMRELNRRVRSDFIESLKALGLKVYSSEANFVLVHFGPHAEEIRLALKARGILVRQMGAYQLPECLRITIGTDEDMQTVSIALAEILEKKQIAV